MKRLQNLFCFCALLCSSIVSVSAVPSIPIAIGGYVDYAIREDGTLLAWGVDDYGLLGPDGNGRSYQNPVSLMKDARFVQGVRNGVLVIDRNHVLWGIGSNWFGVLGSHTTSSPTHPTVILRQVATVSAGNRHCLAVKLDGSLWGWGLNEFGQLGDTKRDPSKPYDGLLLEPFKLMDSVKAAKCSGYDSYVLTEDGRLLNWGSPPNLTQNNSPTCPNPVELTDDVASIEDFGVIKTDGSLWGWESGDETTPTAVAPRIKIMDNVKQCSSGNSFFFAVKTDGSLWSWGKENALGQLGIGTTKAQQTPQKIMNDVSYVTCSPEHSLVLKTDGTLWQIGYPHTTNLALPSIDRTRFYTPYPLMDSIAAYHWEALSVEDGKKWVFFDKILCLSLGLLGRIL